MEFSHRSVLLAECIEALNIRPDGVYVDGTAGGAGHSLEIAKRLTTGQLIALDKDPAALEAASQRLAGLPATVVRADFQNLPQVLKERGIGGIDGVLLDLGVSSHQLDCRERGFSYREDAPLDMRMSGEGPSAADLINTLPEAELARILFTYGEEKFSRRIAGEIIRRRETAPIATTGALCEIIRESIPAPARRTGGNPAKRSFQAIRIAVNGELDCLEVFLSALPEMMNPGGRAAIITFHSLEDRLVKQAFVALAVGCICPPGCPICICGHTPTVRLVSRKPILPTEAELLENRRSQSAKLRVAEFL